MPRSSVAYFSFGGVSTKSYQITVDSSDTLVKPTRDVERITIPGMSGGLTVDNGRFNDVSVTYHCFIKRGVDANFNGFLAALLSMSGEQKLKDDRMDLYYTGTYNGLTSPGCYRKAILDSSVKAEEVYAGYSGAFDITFTCKPQLFLNVGDLPIEVTQGTVKTVVNPTKFASAPLLQLYGKGTGTTDATMARFSIGAYTIGVNVNCPTSYCWVDCETEDAYYQAQNYNSYIKAISGSFPRCIVSDIGATASITSPNSGGRMLIYPRWWTV